MSKKQFAGSPNRRTDNRFLINNFMNFSLTEAYNTARTNIMFSLATKKKKTVAFTSYSPADGKSSTAVNMALTFAKTQAKVLLIDADMRKPSVQTLLKVKNSHGLSTLISGLCSVDSAVNRNVEENLDVICAGPIPPNPAELLASPYMAELLTRFQSEYDFIFIDTPPVSMVSDALLLNNLISGIVLVVRENGTKHPEIESSLNSIRLANGKVLGFIKVACKVKKHRYGLGNKYGYYYKYGEYYGYGYTKNKTDKATAKKTKKLSDKPTDETVDADSEEKTSKPKKKKLTKSEKVAQDVLRSIAELNDEDVEFLNIGNKHKSETSGKTGNNAVTDTDLDGILNSTSADIERYRKYLNEEK